MCRKHVSYKSAGKVPTKPHISVSFFECVGKFPTCWKLLPQSAGKFPTRCKLLPQSAGKFPTHWKLLPLSAGKFPTRWKLLPQSAGKFPTQCLRGIKFPYTMSTYCYSSVGIFPTPVHCIDVLYMGIAFVFPVSACWCTQEWLTGHSVKSANTRVPKVQECSAGMLFTLVTVLYTMRHCTQCSSTEPLHGCMFQSRSSMKRSMKDAGKFPTLYSRMRTQPSAEYMMTNYKCTTPITLTYGSVRVKRLAPG